MGSVPCLDIQAGADPGSWNSRMNDREGKKVDIKDILVHQGDDIHADRALKAGVILAKQCDARLTGVHVLQYPELPTYIEAQLPNDVVERTHQEVRKRGEARQETFERAMAGEGISGEFRIMEGHVAEAVALCGRYADLLVVGQPDPDHPSATDGLPEVLLLAAGRPVLVVPYVGEQRQIGRRIMIAWNATREATRAVHDAMPILEKADEVIVFSINSEYLDYIVGAEISTHLVRHGVNATPKHVIAPDMQVGDNLLSAIVDHDIDLLVMGGYGHSRLRELAFGGATRDVLQSMTCPVMMSH
jgi:nucleotide-binding universal stress UspA family protein